MPPSNPRGQRPGPQPRRPRPARLDTARAASYDEASAYIHPTPDEELSERDRLEIRVLDGLDNPEFDKRVNEWITRPDESGSRVFFSRTLAPRTFEATGRIHAHLDRQMAKYRHSNPARYEGIERYKQRVVAVRQRAKRIRATLKEVEHEESTRQQARRVMGDAFPVLFREVHNAIRDGEDPADLVAELKQRYPDVDGRARRGKRKDHP